MSALPPPDDRAQPGRTTRYGRLAGYAALAIALAAALVLLWWIVEVVLLGFAAILGATLLRLIARPLARFTPLPYGACLVLAGLLVVGIIAWTLYLFGSEFAREFDVLLDKVREGSAALEQRLSQGEIGRAVLRQAHQAGGAMGGELRRVLSLGATAIAGVVIIVFTAAYFAAQPRLYADGFLTLVPPAHRERAGEALDRVGLAIHRWLLGQLIEMAAIGSLVALATWLIGLPTPLALGLIAFVTEFVPYLGPIAAAIPALLVAFTQGLDAALWTFGAYLAIHLFEGNILMPMLQRWLVSVQPALMLLGIAAFGVLFGLLGVILAAPLVVAISAAVRKLYVEDVLDEPARPPGWRGAAA